MNSDLPSTLEIPNDFICPITLNIMSHPLCDRAGHSFDRHAILSWINKDGTNPLTREPMKPSDLIPNTALEARIRYFAWENKIDHTLVVQPDEPSISTFWIAEGRRVEQRIRETIGGQRTSTLSSGPNSTSFSGEEPPNNLIYV